MDQDERIARRLRLKDLHTLQAVAELGSMAKASRILALSQPAISKAIADLEHAIRTPLLERSARGVELTPSGRALLERARNIFDELRAGLEAIANISDPARGVVRVGTTEPLSSFLSEVVSRMSQAYPRISYAVTLSDTTTLVRDLRERRLDIVLTRWTAGERADDLAAEVLFEAPLGVMADRRHPLVQRKKLSLLQTMNEVWTLSPPDSFLGQVVGEVFRNRKLALPHSVVTTLSIHMRLNLLASGRFLTMLPMRIAQHRAHRAWLRALPIDLPDSTGQIAMLRLARRSVPGALASFMQACREGDGL